MITMMGRGERVGWWGLISSCYLGPSQRGEGDGGGVSDLKIDSNGGFHLL